MRQIIHLPSSGGHGEYDLYALGPGGMAADQAKARVNREIQRANLEDRNNEAGGCSDGLPVEDSIKAALTREGFEFITPVMTSCWDDNPA